MPEIGGNKLAGDLSTMLSDIRKRIDQTRSEIQDASNELLTEIDNGAVIAKAIRAEAASVRQAFGSVLGNASAGENLPSDAASQEPSK